MTQQLADAAAASSVYEIPGPLFQAPTAYVWILTARLVTGQGLPPSKWPGGPDLCPVSPLLSVVPGLCAMTGSVYRSLLTHVRCQWRRNGPPPLACCSPSSPSSGSIMPMESGETSYLEASPWLSVRFSTASCPATRRVPSPRLTVCTFQACITYHPSPWRGQQVGCSPGGGEDKGGRTAL